MPSRVVSGIRRRFQRLSQSQGQVTHVLLTRSPLIPPASWSSSFDLHVLSTPPAFVLSQDQTLRKCLIARQPKSPAHCLRPRTGIGSEAASLKLTEQIITDLLCCLNVFQRNPTTQPEKVESPGFWHLTLCTLLSSQGSDAPAFHPSGLLRRATSLTYHSRSSCQIECFGLRL